MVSEYNVTECLYDSMAFGSECSPSNAFEFVLWLNRLISKVPVQFQDSVQIDFSAGYNYGDPIGTLTVYYMRDETDAEKAERVAIANRRRAIEIQHAKETLARYGVDL